MSKPEKFREQDAAPEKTDPGGCLECDCTCVSCLLAAPVGPNIARMADLIAHELNAQIAARLSEIKETS